MVSPSTDVADRSPSPPRRGRADAPVARRLALPSWLDLRLVTGVVIVLASVLVGARVVSGAQHETSVLVAAHPLAAGERLAPADLTERQMRLGATASAYLTGSVPVGYVVTRPVGAGELVPAAAVAAAASSPPVRLVAVPVDSARVPDGLGRGSTVDMYAAPKAGAAGTTRAAAPTLVADGLVVDSRNGGSRSFGAAVSQVSVVLDVPLSEVSAVVAAVDLDDVDLVVIPAGS